MNRNDLILLGLLMFAGALSAAAAAQERPGRPTLRGTARPTPRVATTPAPAAPAPYVVTLVDGTTLAAARLRGDGRERLQVGLAQGGTRAVPWRDVLSLHSQPAVPPALPVVELVGGDRLHGVLAGGDAGGNSLTLQSPVLGTQQLAVDRLACVVLQKGVAPAALQLPDDVDEALFQRARVGFDRLAGTLHQFGDGRLRYQPAGDAEPRWFDERNAVGLRIRGGLPPESPPATELVTRTGDRLGVGFRGLDDDALQLELEGGRAVTVPLADVACLTFLDHGAVFLSALTPTVVQEAGPDGPPLWPYRADAAIDGRPLTVGRRTWGRGLGVHSRSRLVFTAPAGAVSFWAQVAFDDQALELPVRGVVDVRVEVDDAVAFERRSLRAGEPAVPTGVIAVEPGQQVALVVDFGLGRDVGDRVDWLSAVFVRPDK